MSNKEKKSGDKKDIIESVSDISSSSVLFFSGSIVGNGLGFVVTKLLTSTLGPSLFGYYSYTKSVSLVLTIFSKLGSDEAILRYVQFDDSSDENPNEIATLAYLTTLILSSILVVILYLIAPVINSITFNSQTFLKSFRILVILIPAYSLVKVSNSIYRARGILLYKVIINNITRYTLEVSFILLAAYLGFSLFGISVFIVISAMLNFCISMYIIKNIGLTVSIPHSTGTIKKYYSYVTRLLFNDVGSVFMTKTDILVLGMFASSSSVGIYTVAALISSLLSLPLSSVSQLYAPAVSNLHIKNNSKKISDLHSVFTRWLFGLSFFAFCYVTVFGRDILLIFGRSFSEGYIVLVILLFGRLVRNSSGLNGQLLAMTDHPGFVSVDELAVGITNVILNLLLVPQYGILGAAVATAISLSLLSFTRVLGCMYLEDINPYSKSYLKLFFSSSISVIFMILIEIFSTGIPSIIISMPVTLFVFLFSYYMFGINELESKLLSRFIRGLK